MDDVKMPPLTEAQLKKMEELAEKLANHTLAVMMPKAEGPWADDVWAIAYESALAALEHRDEPSNELNDALAAASIHAEEHRKARIKIAQLQQELVQVTANGKNAVECLQGALTASQAHEKILREALKHVEIISSEDGVVHIASEALSQMSEVKE